MKTKQYLRGGTLVGMFVGLVLGVVIAAVVVWYTKNMLPPFVSKAPHVQNGKPGQPPMPLPGKPGDPVPEEKRFQFYDILPGKTEAVPNAAPASSATAAPETAAPEKRHYLQAGSFSNSQEADNLKATLAMIGQEADIQQVMVQDKTFYRLRLGPYAKIDDASRVRAELAKSGVETILIDRE
jgi:cell division protein FtsN